MDALFDEIDEDQAQKFRRDFGKRAWVVSWLAQADGSWLARLSGPGHPATVERTGRTRAEAIARASRTFRQVLDFKR